MTISATPLTRRRNGAASNTLQSTPTKRKTLSRKRLFAFLFIPIFAIIFSVLVVQLQPGARNNAEKWDPIIDAKKAFSLVSENATITSTVTSISTPAIIQTIPTITTAKSSKNWTQICFPYNSANWLHGPRLGNYNDSLLYNTTSVRETLLWESTTHQLKDFFSPDKHGLARTILSQTICHQNSRFLNLSSYTDLRMWSLRLIYLSLHLHQHEPAMLEARQRYSLPPSLLQACQAEYQKHQVGAYDYECPNAKFLVVAMGRLGLGAVMRLGAVNFYIAGISSGRIVLFINNYHHHHLTNRSTTNVPKSLQDPWMHASCTRRDVQCFFSPSSPCVLTVQELEHAYTLNKGETRQVFRTGDVPPNRKQDRIIILDMSLRPQRCPETFFPTLRNMSLTKIIEPLKEQIQQQQQQQPNSERLEQIQFLERAADYILDSDIVDTTRSYHYFGQSSKAHHALVFYAMRPNLYYTQRMEQIIANTVPRDTNPEYSLGLPIRASDKCLMESECLSFPTYMKLMGQIWMKHVRNDTAGLSRSSLGNVIVTSESGGVLRDKKTFEANQTLVKSLPFSLRFIMNEHDVLQGTGLPRNFQRRFNQSGTPYSQDDIMLSAVSSLKVQLMAKYTVGNCCSNFHLLLFDFLWEGCGAASTSVHRCLQENENPEFRVCCMWSDSEECKIRKEIKEARQKSRSNSKSSKQLTLQNRSSGE